MSSGGIWTTALKSKRHKRQYRTISSDDTDRSRPTAPSGQIPAPAPPPPTSSQATPTSTTANFLTPEGLSRITPETKKPGED